MPRNHHKEFDESFKGIAQTTSVTTSNDSNWLIIHVPSTSLCLMNR